MKKWAYLSVSVALVVTGCGGSGGGSHTTIPPGPGGVPGTNVQINLGSTTGTAEFLYLTGQGRAPGDLTAVVSELTLQDKFGTVQNSLAGNVSLPLNQFVSQYVRLDVPFVLDNGTVIPNSRLFENFSLVFDHFSEEGSDPTVSTTLTAPTPTSYPAHILVMPGRNTSVPIFVDDSMFADNGAGGVSFNDALFRAKNLDPTTNQLTSFFSDYVSFDISNMAASSRPQLSDGSFATKFLTSGDNYAIGSPAASANFEVLTLDSTQPLVGNYLPPRSNTPGTYNLTQLNPTDLSGKAKITSLRGTFNDSQTVMSGFGQFEMIVFPNIQDKTQVEFVMVYRGSTGIQALYYGLMDYALHKFQAFPVKDLVSASTAGELDGTIGEKSLSDKTTIVYHTGDGKTETTVPDAVRYGTYTFNSGQTLPAGFFSTGTFIVYRK